MVTRIAQTQVGMLTVDASVVSGTRAVVIARPDGNVVSASSTRRCYRTTKSPRIVVILVTCTSVETRFRRTIVYFIFTVASSGSVLTRAGISCSISNVCTVAIWPVTVVITTSVQLSTVQPLVAWTTLTVVVGTLVSIAVTRSSILARI